MFAIGDRKPELKKVDQFEGDGQFRPQDFFDFHDEQGNVVGNLIVSPDPITKQLYVDWVGGLGKFGPSSFGPSLIRDILRQLKEAYPEFETIAGHRVSGARYSDKIVEDYAKKLAERDGFKWDELIPSEMTGYIDEAHASYKNPTDKVVTKLALGDAFELSREYTDLRRILETSPTKFGDVTAGLVPKELWTTMSAPLAKRFRKRLIESLGRLRNRFWQVIFVMKVLMALGVCIIRHREKSRRFW